MFRRIVQKLVRGRFQHKVAQCQANIKVLTKNTKHFLNRVRESGACHESVKEMGVPLYFQLYVKTDTLMAGTLCQPHVLDSESRRR